jgi:diguanylate cyclase (GGDEF)-like protein/PAS domain S-box-containing protein
VSINRFIKLYAVSLLLLVGVAILIYQITQQHLRQKLVVDLQFSSNTLISQLSEKMENTFDDIASDLTFLASDHHLILFHRDNTNRHAEQALAELWFNFANHRKHYDQLRFLDNHGLEVIRINYNRGQPSVVPRHKLQSKQHRYYFVDIIDQPAATIYASPLDLNVENRQVELPLKPILRFGTPVNDENGSTIGIMLINYLADDILDHFTRSVSGFRGQAILINNDGYALVSPDSSQAWSFMFPDSPQSNLRTQHPNIWNALNSEQRGQYLTPDGLYTFSHVDPSSITKRINCKACLSILLFTPEEQITSLLEHEMGSVLPSLFAGLLLVAIFFGLLLWHWDRRRLQQAEISSLNEQIAFERDLFVSGPGTIIKLRNEIGWPVDYCSSNIKDLLGHNQESFLKRKLTYASIIDPDYLPQYISETEAANHTGTQIFKRSPYQIIDRDGNRKWVQDVCRTMRNRFGKVSHYYAHISDITPLKETEHKLAISHDYIQKVIDTLPDSTVVINISDYSLQLTNQAARALYNGNREIDKGMACYRLFHKRGTPCTGLSEPCPIHEVMLTGKPVSVRHKHFDYHGNTLYIDVRSTPLFDSSGQKITQIVESHHDVTATVEMEKQLQHLAITDRLTQVYNRLKFDEELKSQIEWAHDSNNTLGLIMFDLDHFKQVNDNHGHDIGDLVLKNTVELVQKNIRRSDTLARWGGEEFMIITPLTDIFELKTICESLRQEIEQLTHTQAGHVTASFGGSILRSGDTIATLVKRVDAALYQSKQSGRNCSTIIE